MTKINCSYDCIYCKDGICSKDEIEMSKTEYDCYEMIHCLDYESK